jgi:ATPase family protein associated with various cellular activities (AAA)
MAELMQLMDGLKNVPGVLWVGTTNRPEVVETALADRPGRFDRRLKFGPLPDAEHGRLVERLVMPQTLSPQAHELATRYTKDMTGAQVRDLAETLRILSENERFEVSDVRDAWKDCGFVLDQPFGFANTVGNGVVQLYRYVYIEMAGLYDSMQFGFQVDARYAIGPCGFFS